jgi:rhodanese-related sulfurtransferase
MERKFKLIPAVLGFIVCMCLSAPLSADELKTISLEELKANMAAGEEIMLINPLSDILFNEGYIPGSANIPLSELAATDKLPSDKKRLIVSYCSGPRSTVSRKAAGMILNRGYRNVRWFREGAVGWVLAGYPLEHRYSLPKVPVSGLDAVQLRGRLQEVFVVDIRPPSLYEGGWIKGSHRVPIDDLSKKYVELPKGKKIVVVDQTGNQVIVVARFLEQKGYDVHGLQGGIMSWVSQGYPIEK